VLSISLFNKNYFKVQPHFLSPEKQKRANCPFPSNRVVNEGNKHYTRLLTGVKAFMLYNNTYMNFIKKALKLLARTIGIIMLVWIVFVAFTPAKTDRDWNADQIVQPEISINGDEVIIKNIRNIKYRTTNDYDLGYYNSSFNLNDLESVWFMVEPFSTNPGAAHTLVSFGFKGDKYLAISVEIRKEKGESFSAVKGMLRRYELMYVIADERDVIKLRSNYRHDQVFLYPIKTDKEKIRALFLDMLARADKLQKEPEFYNTLTSTCTTNIVSHINKLVPNRVPFDYRILLPGLSDTYAFELGLIDTDLSFEEAREKFKINSRAEKYADSPEFSKMIRD